MFITSHQFTQVSIIHWTTVMAKDQVPKPILSNCKIVNFYDFAKETHKLFQPHKDTAT